MTARGQKTFATLDARQNDEVASMLRRFRRPGNPDWSKPCAPSKPCSALAPKPRTPYILRSHQPGDMGWVVHRHGVLYAQEYGYDETFEALVAEIAAKFIQHSIPGASVAGSLKKTARSWARCFWSKKSKTVAKLRLLLVEPSARGLGIGKRLVDECLRFARQAGYKKMVLWTQSELPAARHIYQEAGFQLVAAKERTAAGGATIWYRRSGN